MKIRTILAVLVILFAHHAVAQTQLGLGTRSVTAECQFLSVSTTAAFCEAVTAASSGGRAGDLNDAVWSVSRTVTDGNGGTGANLFPQVTVSACKTGVTSTGPDNDITFCDSASGHLGQFQTAIIAQNYAGLSMRPRQQFSFSGRTGVIAFNVDAITQGEGSWWPAVYVADQPVSYAINSASVQGYLPTNGVGFNFNDNCAVMDNSLTAIDGVFVFTNTVESFVSFSSPVCFSTKRGQLNHIEIQISTTAVAVYASDYSPDNVTFPNFRLVGSASTTVPFSSGWVLFLEKERAPIKNEPGFYNPGYANNYWSGLGFDGPVITGEAGYEVADSLTVDPNSASDNPWVGASGGLNTGYQLLNTPFSMYACCTNPGGAQIPITTLSIPGVSLTGVTSAQLSFTVLYTYVSTFNTGNVGLQYSLNGGSFVSPSTQPNYAAQNLCTGCPGTPNGGGGVMYSFSVSVGSLTSGTNTIAFQVVNSINSFPPVIGNIDLITFQ